MWVADGKVLVSAGHDGVAFWANQERPAANGNRGWSRLATLRLTSDGWYAFTSATEERGFVTAGFSPSVLSDVIFDGHSGGLVWEGLRDDALLGRLFR